MTTYRSTNKLSRQVLIFFSFLCSTTDNPSLLSKTWSILFASRAEVGFRISFTFPPAYISSLKGRKLFNLSDMIRYFDSYDGASQTKFIRNFLTDIYSPRENSSCSPNFRLFVLLCFHRRHQELQMEELAGM